MLDELNIQHLTYQTIALNIPNNRNLTFNIQHLTLKKLHLTLKKFGLRVG